MMGWVTNDARLKLMSLLLATCTWFFVKGITSDWRLIEGVPLEVKARTGLTVLQASAATDQRDRPRHAGGRAPGFAAGFVGGRGLEPGQSSWDRSRSSSPRSRSAIPGALQVSEIDPPEVTVNVDQMIERELPVQPQFSGELPPSLSIERVVIEPETIR